MRPRTVKTRVAAVRLVAHDAEAAHVREDDLYEEVLEAIAKGNPDGPEMAAIALRTKDIEFPRYHA
jgi:hypothetical protein